jgi:YHS domain-containing protein
MLAARSARHTRAAAFIGMASLLPFHGARPAAAAPGPDETPVVCVAENHTFTLKDLRGRYAILHFLPTAPLSEQESYIREHITGERTLAGVFTVFIRPDAAGARVMSEKFGKQPAEFAADADSKLASELNIRPGAGPVVVAFDETGRELFRLMGTPQDLTFAKLHASLASAWSSPATAQYNLPKGSTLAIDGYDVVSYFADNKASKGDEQLTAEYRGVTYRFATTAHRDAFVANPSKYLPTYGGWCASAIGAKGEKVSIDPTNFKVKDGRLFLFYKSLFANALTDWNKHEKEWEPAADTNWKKISGEGPTADR